MPVAVSAVVINYNSGADLVACLRSVEEQTYAVSEVVVVDNGSTDQSMLEATNKFPHIRPILNGSNRGPAAAGNSGAMIASGDILIFLNPDVVLSSECVARLVEALDERDGVVAPVLLVGPSLTAEYGSTIDRLGQSTALTLPGKPLYVTASVMATSRHLFRRLGGFDERYFWSPEDVDYCWRVLLAGGNVTVLPDLEARHRGGGSTAGGYVKGGRMETTVFRLKLRERNTLTMLLKCAPAASLIWVVPAYLVKTGFLAVAAFLLGRPGLARDLFGGLVWNARELPLTFRLRRNIPRSKAGAKVAAERMYRGFLALEYLIKFGPPRFVDSTPRQVSEYRSAAQTLRKSRRRRDQ